MDSYNLFFALYMLKHAALVGARNAAAAVKAVTK